MRIASPWTDRRARQFHTVAIVTDGRGEGHRYPMPPKDRTGLERTERRFRRPFKGIVGT